MSDRLSHWTAHRRQSMEKLVQKTVRVEEVGVFWGVHKVYVISHWVRIVNKIILNRPFYHPLENTEAKSKNVKRIMRCQVLLAQRRQPLKR